MTRKAARGRKGAAGRSGKSEPRAASRTGKKTASARVARPAARKPAERERERERRAGARAPERAVAEKRVIEQVPAVRPEEDEDLDWLTEDEEDPRSQIVEDDDEWERNHEEEW